MTLPDEFADVLAGTVAVADPRRPAPAGPLDEPEVAPQHEADAGTGSDAYPGSDADLRHDGEEVDLLLDPDGHVDLRLLSDVQVELAVELGRITLPLRALLGLAPGSVLQLDRPASAPVDVLVGGSPVSRGEVVVIGGDFGVRVTSLVDR